MSSLLRACVALVALMSSLATAWGATPPPVDQVFQLHVSRDDGGLTLVWSIAPGNYLYRAMIGANDASPPGGPIAIRTPPGQPKDDPDYGPQEVYHDAVNAEIEAADLRNRREIVVSYQGCAEAFRICYPPVRQTIDLATLDILDEQSARASSSGGGRASSFVDAPAALTDGSVAAAVPETPAGPAMPLSSWVTLGGMLASFFGLGTLLSLSPCTFPMVPIFFSLLARSQEPTSRLRGLGLAAVFVGSSASAYASLGAFAAWSGSGENLQILLQTPLALGATSVILVILSLSMFGLFELQLPASWSNRLSGLASDTGYGPVAAAIVLGFGSALVASPCVTPPLASALLYVARTGDVAQGMAALFLFGVGLGVPLLIFGTLGAGFLPKPGPWLVRVRYAFGFILLGLAVSIFSRVLPQWLVLQLWGALLTGVSVYLGTQFLLARSHWRFAWMGLAASTLLVASVLLIGSAGDDSLFATRILSRLVALNGPAADDVRVVRSVAAFDRELETARAENKPVMLDFSADWCVECRLMDAVLRKPELNRPLQDFRVVRADVTAVDADSRALMERFDVVGPPTILLFGPQAQSAPDVRIVGAVDADTMRSKLSTVATAE